MKKTYTCKGYCTPPNQQEVSAANSLTGGWEEAETELSTGLIKF